MFNKFKSLNIGAKIFVVVGIIIIIAGIYYVMHDLKSYGVSMGEAGEPYQAAVINGWGMIFCGLLIVFFGYFFDKLS